METDIGAGRPCVLVARFFHRHAHSSKFHNKAPAFVVSFRHCTLQLHNAILCLSSRFQVHDRLKSSTISILFDYQNEDTSQHAAGTRMTKVKFVLRRRCDFGQRFFVIGDDKLLGGWAPEAAIPMQWSEGHVWTLQLDLLSGTCTEFKILLKADEEVVEWQPGPNHKLEVLDSVTSLLVFVSWPDGEDNLENEPVQSLEMNDMRETQEIMEIAPSARSLSDMADNVENLDFKAAATVRPDVYAKPKAEASNADSESSISNAKQVAPGIIAGDQSLIDEGIFSNAKPSEEFLSLYPVPEAWYVQESHDIQANLDCKDPSPGLLEKNANGRTLTSASELSDNEEYKAGQKDFLSNHSNDWIAEAKSSEGDNEHIRMKENEEQLTRSVPSNAGTELIAVELKDIQKESAQNARTGQTGSFAEPKEELVVDPAVLDSEEPTSDEQVMVGKDPIEASAESSTVATPAKGGEFSSIHSEPFESVETKSAKIKRWGPKGWSKLWGAIVQGRIE